MITDLVIESEEEVLEMVKEKMLQLLKFLAGLDADNFVKWLKSIKKDL